MKIKQLFESQSNYTITLVYEFTFSGYELYRTISQNKENVSKEITEKLGPEGNCRLQLGSDSLSVFLEISEKDLDSIEWFRDNVTDVLFEYVPKIYEEKNDHRLELSYSGDFPRLPHKLNFQNIYITPKGKSNLKDVHKYIEEFEYLEINNCDEIDGNVLGVLKLGKPLKTQVRLVWSSVKVPLWVEILNKYHRSRDVLSCHEELVDNGLEDYAQL